MVLMANALFEWWSWRYDDEAVVLTCMGPPAVAIISFVLFRWALEGRSLFPDPQSRNWVIAAVLVGGLQVATLAAAIGAKLEAEQAAYTASDAADRSSEASSSANSAHGMAMAARDAVDALRYSAKVCAE